MWSSKGYKVFRVTLIIRENNKDAGAWLVINHRIVKNFRFWWILWWRHNHWTFSNTILPNEDLGKVHVAPSITTIPSVSNRVLSVSSEINTTSIVRAWKKNAQFRESINKITHSVKLFVMKEAILFFLNYYSFYYHFLAPKSDSARAHATSGWLGRTGRQIHQYNCGQNTFSLAKKLLRVRSNGSKILLQCSFFSHKAFESNDHPSSMWKMCHILTTWKLCSS